MYQSLTLHDCGCPTDACPHCGSADFYKHGFFYRKGDARRIRRYRCNSCCRTFSRAGFSVFYRHRHRRLSERIRELLVNTGTQRGVAKQLRIDKDTVARRIPPLAKLARHRQALGLASAPLAKTVQFDELMTFEHSKMKPLSVSVITDADRWRVMGFEVARIPASGLLAAKSRKKYGPRPDDSIKARKELFARTAPYIDAEPLVQTDQHSAYPSLVNTYLQDATHERFPSAKPAVVGQGELKALTWDPLFCINHQLAMCRAKLSRLFRRSWNTTKLLERLCDLLALHFDHYNRFSQPKSGREFCAKHDA